MKILKAGKLDINEIKIIKSLKFKLQQHFNNEQNYHNLKVQSGGSFSLENKITTSSGWYLILDNNIPIYVGKSSDLNKRLNTPSGSQDNFANSERKSDAERNFIKKYTDISCIKKLRVCIISENDLSYENLTNLDKNNIEKFINLTRSYYTFKKRNTIG